MKTIKITFLTLTAVIFILFGFCGKTHSYDMNMKPAVNKTIKPGQKYVWVPGHYKHNKHGKLVWIPGHWKRI